MTWTPAPREDVDFTILPLDALHGFLLSRLDGRTDVPMLANLTGLGPEQVSTMLQDLVTLGAIAPSETSHSSHPPRPSTANIQADGPATSKKEDTEPEVSNTEPEVTDGEALNTAPEDTEDKALSTEPEDTEGEECEPDTAEIAATMARETTHRQLFEMKLHSRSEDERAALARVAEEPELSAYCFDPMPKVISALLENARIGGVQARLIAAHHRTANGLEALASRAAFAHDPGVRRALLSNPVLPTSLYRRLWSGQRLLSQFLITTSRDYPEQTRAMARELLRSSFNQRQGEERVEIILTTEGRCLVALTGLTIDGQTTALLCRRSYTSTLLIQNIARWSAAPPQLIAHLRRQEVVRRNAVLRQMLERHPNAG